jgi:PleD family two-component response regulator
MSAPSSLEIEERLARIRKSYGATLHEKIDRLQRTARDFHPENERRTRTSLEEARALSHNVAGSAPTFGYARIGQLARALEYRLENILGSRARIGSDSREEVEDLLRQIAQEEKQSQIPTASQSTSPAHHRLLVAQGRRWLGREFVLAFERHGFEIQVSDEVESTFSHAEAFRPDVLIVTALPEETTGFELAARFWDKNSFSNVEVFFFVKSQEFRDKALLNRIPVEWFMVQPFDSQELASRMLRRLFNIKIGREQNNRPYLAPYLEMFKKLAVARGDQIILAPLAAPMAAANLEERRLNPKRRRVLVVDDDRHLVDAICEVLQSNGLQLFKAYSGFQGVQMATREVPDLIITDFEMPNGSAEYLITNLRQSEATKSIKVIVITGHEVLERYSINQDPASYLKAVSYQPKPVDLDGLCGEVQRHLAAGVT